MSAPLPAVAAAMAGRRSAAAPASTCRRPRVSNVGRSHRAARWLRMAPLGLLSAATFSLHT
ncbi:hypothetical protein DCC79_00195 [bacterium]|nr:MAG: hypothetical protein DCC79_00195 [bacterium]